MTSREQIDAWVDGNPKHNNETGECTPDFSCCKPDLLAPLEDRERFRQALIDDDEKTVKEMLMIFLTKMLDNAGMEPFMATGRNPNENICKK